MQFLPDCVYGKIPVEVTVEVGFFVNFLRRSAYQFFQTDGKATNGVYHTWGNYSVFDADAVLHPLYHSEVGGWIGKWYTRVEGLDKLIDEGRSTLNQPARKRVYSQIQKMTSEEIEGERFEQLPHLCFVACEVAKPRATGPFVHE